MELCQSGEWVSSGEVSLNSNSVDPPNRAVSDTSCGCPRTLRSLTAGPADVPFSSVTAIDTAGSTRRVSTTTTFTCEGIACGDGRHRDVAEYTESIESHTIEVGHGLAVWTARPRLDLLEHDGLFDVTKSRNRNGGDRCAFVLLRR